MVIWKISSNIIVLPWRIINVELPEDIPLNKKVPISAVLTNDHILGGRRMCAIFQSDTFKTERLVRL